ncbi:hypothetical protein ONV78_05925 [Hahella sp. CR1]|uniref:hypothetical protein n=1 Tax=Hahella sp. CR1 TaxID=2992807 RepID=UPI0024418FA7|nr:hypothetical protein [Hahella sp. CR1]MDG9667270.1 hypothetical protein [Hahella sp. CR1]
MDLSAALVGLGIYLLIWEKLPEWGTWFNRVIASLPGPLAKLYEDWRCPYCSGFWIALALHGLVGMTTLSETFRPVFDAAWLTTPMIWFLDALATATLILVGKLALSALSGPALKGHQMVAEFKKAKTVEAESA